MFTRGVGESLDAPVELEPGAVECNLLHARRLGTLGDCLTDRLRRIDVAGVLEPFAHRILHGGRRGKNVSAVRSDDLRVNVLWRAMHAQARHAQLANLGPGTHRAPQSLCFLSAHVQPITSSWLPST